MINAYFDLETTTLNPYVNEAKIILAQVRYNDKSYLFKEWELGEKDLIYKLGDLFNTFPKYTPVVTYNGGFDFNYLISRINLLDFDILQKSLIHHDFIQNVRHCDLLQFDNGYFVPLWKICKKHDMPLQSTYDGKHMRKLYEMKEYDYIIEHGLEDIEILEKLVKLTNIADRFFNVQILTWEERRMKK